MKIKRIFFVFTCLFIVFLCYIGKPEEYKVKQDIVNIGKAAFPKEI